MVNWSELFEQDRTVFHCETEEIANTLLGIADNLGYKWCNSESFLDHNQWNSYGNSTCYDIDDGEFCFLQFYNVRHYNVINVKQLLEQKVPRLLKRK